MQYFTVEPLSATAGSPPGSTQAEAQVKGDDDAEYYVEHLIELLRHGPSRDYAPTARKGPSGWTLVYTGGVGDDEDGWIANCEYIEKTFPGLHALLGVRISFTDGPYGSKAGSVQ